MSLINSTIDLNNIISSLIDERMEKERENPNEKAKEDYNKLNEILENEKLIDNEQITHEQKLKEIQNKIEEKSKRKNKTLSPTSPTKKTWSKLNDKIKEKLINEYMKEKNIKDKTFKDKVLNKSFNSRKIKYDKKNEKIININI